MGKNSDKPAAPGVDKNSEREMPNVCLMGIPIPPAFPFPKTKSKDGKKPPRSKK